VGADTNWKQVDAGNDFIAAIKTDGTLWTWGKNPNGQLGLNDIVNRSSPTQVGANTNWKQVFLGSANGSNHMIATKTNGTLWLCGENINGLLGDNTEIDRSSPVQTVAGGTNWKQSCGSYGHTAAIKTDGTLWVWGRGTSGALGTNDAVHRSSPVQTIAGGTNWKQVDAGGSFGFGTYMVAVTYTES
jgi:alpha-tubulin suppressor-like RCC1 family protein